MAVKTSDLKVLTANRLGDGRVVYLNGDGWTTDLEKALVMRDQAAWQAAELKGEVAVAERVVVEPYLIDVEFVEDGLTPLRLRERIRADGPTTGNSRTHLPLAEAS